MYKLVPKYESRSYSCVENLMEKCFIPFDVANTNYQKFKMVIQGIDEMGQSITPAELQDETGNTMTAAEAKAFVATLP